MANLQGTSTFIIPHHHSIPPTTPADMSKTVQISSGSQFSALLASSKVVVTNCTHSPQNTASPPHLP
jgi:gamma-glutamyl-gamma-aminobutyrate hydrolase PuuD